MTVDKQGSLRALIQDEQHYRSYQTVRERVFHDGMRRALWRHKMAISYLTRFKHRIPEDPWKIGFYLENFLAGAGVVQWPDLNDPAPCKGFLVTLNGTKTFPFRHLYPGWEDNGTTRTFTVFWDSTKKEVDVQVKQQDDYTNHVAAGIAKSLADYYEGELEIL